MQIFPNPRVRATPFHDAVMTEGASAATVYNHMILPMGYEDPEAAYWRLIEGVSMWDVAAERQVELVGPDAAELAQALVPRKVAEQPIGMGWYAPVCDHNGVLLNDPILLKLDEDRYWLSIADSDVLFWARAVAGERSLNVKVFEPDVSPLAVQGPKAENVIASMFGEDVRQLKYFEFVDKSLDGIPLMLARSGWSKQGGFEIYLMDGSRGTDLWNMVKEAGKPWDIGPGSPNAWERVESGLLSWGGDTDDQTNPFEVRLGRFVDLQSPDHTIGIQALRRIKAEGPKRHQLGVKMDVGGKLSYFYKKSSVTKDGEFVGQLSATSWSPRLQQNLGICLVSRSVQPGDDVDLELPDGQVVKGELAKLPFI